MTKPINIMNIKPQTPALQGLYAQPALEPGPLQTSSLGFIKPPAGTIVIPLCRGIAPQAAANTLNPRPQSKALNLAA